MPGIRTFDVEIRRAIAPETLDVLTEAEADAADEEGYLGGNRYYQDLRGWSWDEVRRTFEIESNLIERIAKADDPAAAERGFDEERELEVDEAAEGLFGLDVGVAAAATALSALGATPFISCNAGSFGGAHPAQFPYVGFYLGNASVPVLLDLAETAGVGLDTQEGVARLFARSILDLHNFVSVALERFG